MFVTLKGEAVATDAKVFEGVVNPLSGDYYDPTCYQFNCWLVINGKCYKVGCYSAQLSKRERLEASRMIWKAALRPGD